MTPSCVSPSAGRALQTVSDTIAKNPAPPHGRAHTNLEAFRRPPEATHPSQPLEPPAPANPQSTASPSQPPESARRSGRPHESGPRRMAGRAGRADDLHTPIDLAADHERPINRVRDTKVIRLAGTAEQGPCLHHCAAKRTLPRGKQPTRRKSRPHARPTNKLFSEVALESRGLAVGASGRNRFVSRYRRGY